MAADKAKTGKQDRGRVSAERNSPLSRLFYNIRARSRQMADDKTKTGEQDRDRVAGGQDYEAQHLANEAGVTPDKARDLIKAYGNDREKLMQAAKSLAKPRVRSSRT